MNCHLSFLSAAIAVSAMPLQAATVLIAESFGDVGTTPLSGTTADTYDAALTGSGGSNVWGGATNLQFDGGTNGNNAKVTYLNLGSYINDSKGNADAIFELSVTSIANPDLSNSGGIAFLAFSNTASPVNSTTTHTIASVGSNFSGGSVVYGFGDIDVNGSTTGSSGNPHTVTISLDLTSTYYNGSTQFGQITLSDSVEGTLATTILTSDQDFASISFVLDGLRTGQRARVEYSNLQLIQIPEPSAALLGLMGGLFVLRRRR